MTKDYLIKLTLSVYRVTESWDENDFHKIQLRNLANEILSSFILVSHQNPIADAQESLLESISYFQKSLKGARGQKLIDRGQFIFLKGEYDRIKDWKMEARSVKKPSLKKLKEERLKNKDWFLQSLNERQNKLWKILIEKQTAQVGEIKNYFSEVSKRTLRRDLDFLIKKGLVERKGAWNNIFYKVKEGRTRWDRVCPTPEEGMS